MCGGYIRFLVLMCESELAAASGGREPAAEEADDGFNSAPLAAACLHGDGSLSRVAVEADVSLGPLAAEHVGAGRGLGVALRNRGSVVALEAGVKVRIAVAARPARAQPAEDRPMSRQSRLAGGRCSGRDVQSARPPACAASFVGLESRDGAHHACGPRTIRKLARSSTGEV